MGKQILELLTKMNEELVKVKTEMQDMKTEIHTRFDTIDAKLEDIGEQFEFTNEERINDVGFVADINKLEKELFILKTKNN